MLKCPVCCNGHFRSRYELRRHLTDVASLLNNIRCSQCDEGFPSLLELADHLRTECVDAAGIPFKLKNCPVILVDCSDLSNDSTKASTKQPVTTTAKALGELLSMQQPLTDKENVTEVRNLGRRTPSVSNIKNLDKITPSVNNSKNLDKITPSDNIVNLDSTPSANNSKNLDKITPSVNNSKNLDKITPSDNIINLDSTPFVNSSKNLDKITSSDNNIVNLDKITPSANNSKNGDKITSSDNNIVNLDKITPSVNNSKNVDKITPSANNSKIRGRTVPSILNRKRSVLQSTVEKQPEPTVAQESPSKKLRILSPQELQMLLTTMKQNQSLQTPVTGNQLKTSETSSVATAKKNSTTVQLNPVKSCSKLTEIKAPLSTRIACMSDKSCPMKTHSTMLGTNTSLFPSQAMSESTVKPHSTMLGTNASIIPSQAMSESTVKTHSTMLGTNASIIPSQAMSESTVKPHSTMLGTNASIIRKKAVIIEKPKTFSAVINPLPAARNAPTSEKYSPIQSFSSASKTVDSAISIVTLDSDDDMDSTPDEPEIEECFADNPTDDSLSGIESEPSNVATETTEKNRAAESSAREPHGQVDVIKPSSGQVVLLQRGDQRLGTRLITMSTLRTIYRTVPLLGENARTPTSIQGATKTAPLPTANQKNNAATGGSVSSTSHPHPNVDVLLSGPKQPNSSKKVNMLPQGKRITNIANDRPKLKYINIMHPKPGTLSKEKLREGVTVEKMLSTGFDLSQLTNVYFMCSRCKELYDDLNTAENHDCKKAPATLMPPKKATDPDVPPKKATDPDVPPTGPDLPPKKLTMNPTMLKELKAKPLIVAKRRLERELKGMDMTAEKSVRCDDCAKDFSPEVANLHQLIHAVGLPVLFCVECNDFSTVVHKKLAAHKRVEHPKAPRPKQVAIFVCEFCEEEFKSSNKVVRHRRIHHPVEESLVKRYICSHCGHAFKLKADCKNHERMHTKEKPFACDMCDKKFRISFSLVLHKRTHTGVRPYSCKECGKSFKSHSALAFHKKGVHSNTYDYQCHICPKQFKTLVSLLNHKSTHEKQHKCHHCNRYFANRHTLGVHERKMHLNRERDSFVCIICKASYGRAWSLETHLKTHGYIAENLECLKTMVDAGRVSNNPGELVVSTSPASSAPIKPPRRKKPKQREDSF